MSKYDLMYNDLVTDIINNGVWDKDQQVRTVWADGSPAYTKSIISKQLVFDNTEVPILTTKRVAWKTAIAEMLRFYVQRTSNVDGLKIWDEWMRPDGTIGKAYGFQLGKPIPTGKMLPVDKKESIIYRIFGVTEVQEYSNQVHILIDNLINNPASRRHVISLWNIDDLWDMALYPCVWHSQWLVKEGKLHLIVGARSNDVALGQPFNVFQYYVLQRMIAQVTGYEIGTLTFNINDAHLYERHIEPISEQIKRTPFEAPKLWINPEIKNFDDFTIDDFQLEGYEHHPSIQIEVAI